jgi:hypothetical protein
MLGALGGGLGSNPGSLEYNDSLSHLSHLSQPSFISRTASGGAISQTSQTSQHRLLSVSVPTQNAPSLPPPDLSKKLSASTKGTGMGMGIGMGAEAEAVLGSAVLDDDGNPFPYATAAAGAAGAGAAGGEGGEGGDSVLGGDGDGDVTVTSYAGEESAVSTVVGKEMEIEFDDNDDSYIQVEE